MPRTFLRELRRRPVYRVAAVYAVIGWLLIQIATQIFPFFALPNWSVRLTVLIILIGFPIALMLAWAFDATPRGVVRAEDAGMAPRQSRHAGLAVGLIGVVLAAIAGGAWWISGHGSKTLARAGHATFISASAGSADLSLPRTMAGPVPIGPKSVAVLPFENMSEDKSNGYFAQGMQDMVLTKLADIGDLKVISRTSTEQYASHPANLKVVARQLAVANILEGSVQKAGDQVLINVQLIDARSDTHLWAQAYQRTLDNIFGVEGDVAQQIAQALHATLTEREQQTLAVKPTQNAAAYDAYLRGLAASLNADSTADQYRQTAGYYAEAVQHDPGFALAWAGLSEVDSRIYQLHYDRSTQLATAAKNAAETALKLAPDSGDAWLARGVYFFRVESNYAEAITALTQARRRLPNSGEVLAAFADVEARQGRWDAAIADIDKTSVVDPRNARLLLLHVRIHAMRREFPDASAVLAHALAVAPDDPSLIACEASIAQALGHVDRAQALLAQLPSQPDDPPVFKTRIMQWLYRHEYGPATQALQTALGRPESSLGSDVGDYYYLLGFAQQLAGNAAAARATWLAAQGKLEALQKSFPDDPDIAADLGLVKAGLGDKNAALALGEQAVKLQPASIDATLGPAWEEQLARIQAQTGEKDRAIASLQHLLQTPYYSAFYGTAITPALLRLDPVWDPLRGDPRFEALLVKHDDAQPAAATTHAISNYPASGSTTLTKGKR